MFRRRRAFIPDERRSLRIVFFVSSMALVLATGWALWDEGKTRRPWVDYQRQFNRLEQQMVEQALQAAEATYGSPEVQAKVRDLETALAKTEGAVQGPEYSRLQAERAALERQQADKAQQIQFIKSELDEQRYRIEHAQFLCQEQEEHKARVAGKDRGAPEVRKAIEAWRDATVKSAEYQALVDREKSLEKRIQEQEPDLARLEKAIEDTQTKLRRFTEAATKPRDRLADLRAPITALQRRLDGIRARTPEIQQVVVEGLALNEFKQAILTVDRCMACHLGIDRAGFENVPQPFRTHPHREVFFGKHPVSRFGCTGCHQGQGSALTVLVAHSSHELSDKLQADVREGFRKHTYWDRPMFYGEMVQASCQMCHSAQTFIPMAPVLSQGKQLVAQLGCFGCHNLRGFEKAERVGPSLLRIRSKTDPSWMVRWIQDPKGYLPLTKMPNFKLSEDEAISIAAYLLKHSEPEQPYPTAYQPGSAERGRELVSRVGCLGCHRIQEMEALRKGTTALPPGALAAEIPKEGGEAMPASAAPLEPSPPKPGEVKGEVHPVYPGAGEVYVGGPTFGPELSRVASKANAEWLYRWLKDPKRYRPKTNMPNLRLTDQEARDIASYLMTLGRREVRAGLAAELGKGERVKAGEFLIRKRGCFGCHEIKGFEAAEKIAPDLTDFGVKRVDRLFFGEAVEVPQTWEDFVFWKLKNPQIYQTALAPQIMPNFGLKDEEIKALRVFLKSQVDVPVPKAFERRLSDMEVAVQGGRRILQKYNCTGCHVIEGKGGDVATFYEVPQAAPPPLVVGNLQEGEKVQATWLYEWLARPASLRPWLKVRMPTFPVTIDEATTLSKYFAALAGKGFPYEFVRVEEYSPQLVEAGRTLASKEYFDCFSCHVQGSKLPEGPPEGWAPDLSLARRRLRPEWIVKWLTDPQKVQPGTKMPTFYPGGPDDILGGKEDLQIIALRDYIMSIGER
ncbi:MAG: c-type cytochrome [Candidatus Methylomirabilota bacterium]